MKMAAAVGRLLGQHHPSVIYQRAMANDQTFFAPLVGYAAMEQGIPVILLSQTTAVSELDADHAVIVPGEQGPRIFGSEVGTSAMTGAATHFFCEFDPFAPPMQRRKGNFGQIDVPSGNALAILRLLGARAMQIVYSRDRAPPAPPNPLQRATEALQRGDLRGAATELERVAREREQAGDGTTAAMVFGELGGLLDDLGDAGSIAAWNSAARLAGGGQQHVAAAAHAVGATLRHDPRQATLAAEFVARLDAPRPPELCAVLGAIGASAGPAGLGYLAQAAWLVFALDGLFSADNLRSLELLAQRAGATSEPGYLVCAVILLRMLAEGERKNTDPEAMRRAIEIIDRIAHARGTTRDHLVRVLAADDNPFPKVDHGLRSLAARTPWLIPTG